MLDTSRILQKGPEYLRKQIEREREATGRSAAERLAATKPEYLRTQRPLTPETIPNQGSLDRSEEVPDGLAKATGEDPPQEVNVVKRNSSKKRPDSLLLYRNKGELQRGSQSRSGKKLTKRSEANNDQMLTEEANSSEHDRENPTRNLATVLTGDQVDAARKATPGVTGDRGDAARRATPGVTGDRGDAARRATPGVTGDRGDAARRATPGVTGDRGDAARRATPGVTGIQVDAARKATAVAQSNRVDTARKPMVVTSDRVDAARKATVVVTGDWKDGARTATAAATGDLVDSVRTPTMAATSNRVDAARTPTTALRANRVDSARTPTMALRGNHVDTTRKLTAMLTLDPVDADKSPSSVGAKDVVWKPGAAVPGDHEDCESATVKRIERPSRRTRVSRSHSDISSRYSRNFADFDAFFTYCGLDNDVIESVGRDNFCSHSEGTEEEFISSRKIRSVSVVTSDDGFSQASSKRSDGLQEDELPDKKNGQGPSVIERNARIIKWLYSCKNAAQSGKTLRDLD